MLQEEVHRLKMLCEAQQETVPEEVQHQLADAEMALTRALEECRDALRQNRQVPGLSHWSSLQSVCMQLPMRAF